MGFYTPCKERELEGTAMNGKKAKKSECSNGGTSCGCGMEDHAIQ